MLLVSDRSKNEINRNKKNIYIYLWFDIERKSEEKPSCLANNTTLYAPTTIGLGLLVHPLLECDIHDEHTQNVSCLTSRQIT